MYCSPHAHTSHKLNTQQLINTSTQCLVLPACALCTYPSANCHWPIEPRPRPRPRPSLWTVDSGQWTVDSGLKMPSRPRGPKPVHGAPYNPTCNLQSPHNTVTRSVSFRRYLRHPLPTFPTSFPTLLHCRLNTQHNVQLPYRHKNTRTQDNKTQLHTPHSTPNNPFPLDISHNPQPPHPLQTPKHQNTKPEKKR